MKIYHSFWEGGWNKLDDKLHNMHKLSVLAALRSYGNITLITTRKGKEFLGDLPYTSIELFEEPIPIGLKSVWSISKLYAYKQILKKNEPFFHIDYDVFLFKKLPEWFEKSSVVFQHIEKSKVLKEFYDTNWFFKKCKHHYLATPEKTEAYNMGIFGGNDLFAIQYYVDRAFELLFDEENMKEYWLNKNLPIAHCSKAVILEQWYLTFCLDALDIKPTALLDIDNEEKNIDEQSVEYGYCHIWGGKFSKEIQKKVRKKIREYSPVLIG